MTNSLLRITELRVEADNASERASPLIDNVSITIQRGEVLGLIGESGAGKSTLGLAAMGYMRPGCRVTAGNIHFDGLDLIKLPARELRRLRGARIAYIAQSAAASFNPAKRLGQQVAEPLVIHRDRSWKDAECRAAELFEELDLPSPGTFGSQYPHQVSGGQLQRAMIAMALVCEPDLLILDEPTTALDVMTQIEVLAAIKATLSRRDAAALYISHDLALVAQLADRVAVLKSGAIVETGSAAQIVQHPMQDYTKRLTAVQGQPSPEPMGAAPEARSRAPVLTIDDVTASYRSKPGAVRNISLTIDRGETLALVGTSGSGKSTLARVVCGLQPLDSGTLLLDEKALPAKLAARSREELRRIQLIYQSPDTALNPSQAIGTILGRVVSLYFGGSRQAVRARVAELLTMVGLAEDITARRASELSGGQKQRVGIARAIAAQPDLIICDEITSSLDPLIAEDVLALLKNLQQSTGVALLFISHDINVVLRTADSVAVMRAGRVSVQGPVDEVFAPPRHPDAERLAACVPQIRTDWLSNLLARRRIIAEANDPDAEGGNPSDQEDWADATSIETLQR